MKSLTRSVLAGILAIGIAGSLMGCVNGNPLDLGDSPSDSAITIGSQGTPESEILAQIYGQVLVQAGYTVDYNLAIGERDVFLPALASGSIDVVPDYAGALLNGVRPDARATSTAAILSTLPPVLDALGLRMLDAAEAGGGDALVVTPQFSVTNNVVSIGDLAALSGAFTLGADSEFETATYGSAGLESVYGVAGFIFKPIDDGGGPTTFAQLLENDIQVADVSSTNPLIVQNNLVVLADPENLFPAQNVVPLLDADLYSDRIAELLNAVSAKLTTAQLIALNQAYAADSKPFAKTVATDWLTANGFLG